MRVTSEPAKYELSDMNNNIRYMDCDVERFKEDLAANPEIDLEVLHRLTPSLLKDYNNNTALGQSQTLAAAELVRHQQRQQQRLC